MLKPHVNRRNEQVQWTGAMNRPNEHAQWTGTLNISIEQANWTGPLNRANKKGYSVPDIRLLLHLFFACFLYLCFCSCVCSVLIAVLTENMLVMVTGLRLAGQKELKMASRSFSSSWSWTQKACISDFRQLSTARAQLGSRRLRQAPETRGNTAWGSETALHGQSPAGVTQAQTGTWNMWQDCMRLRDSSPRPEPSWGHAGSDRHLKHGATLHEALRQLSTARALLGSRRLIQAPETRGNTAWGSETALHGQSPAGVTQAQTGTWNTGLHCMRPWDSSTRPEPCWGHAGSDRHLKHGATLHEALRQLYTARAQLGSRRLRQAPETRGYTAWGPETALHGQSPAGVTQAQTGTWNTGLHCTRPWDSSPRPGAGFSYILKLRISQLPCYEIGGLTIFANQSQINRNFANLRNLLFSKFANS